MFSKYNCLRFSIGLNVCFVRINITKESTSVTGNLSMEYTLLRFDTEHTGFHEGSNLLTAAFVVFDWDGAVIDELELDLKHPTYNEKRNSFKSRYKYRRRCR